MCRALIATSREQAATWPFCGANSRGETRRDKRTCRAVIAGLLQLSRLIASHLETVPVRKRAERSMAIVAAMVGAVTLARIAPDSRISVSVLVATRDDIIRRSVRRQR
jgi:hypothetical protein